MEGSYDKRKRSKYIQAKRWFISGCVSELHARNGASDRFEKKRIDG